MNTANWTVGPQHVECSDVYAANSTTSGTVVTTVADHQYQFDRRRMGYATTSPSSTDASTANNALFWIGGSSSSYCNGGGGNSPRKIKANNNHHHHRTLLAESNNHPNSFADNPLTADENSAAHRFDGSNPLLSDRRSRSVDDATMNDSIVNYDVGGHFQKDAFDKKLEQLSSSSNKPDDNKTDRQINGNRIPPIPSMDELTKSFKRASIMFDTKKAGFPRIRFNARAPLLHASSQLLPRSFSSPEQRAAIETTTKKNLSQSLQSLRSNGAVDSNDDSLKIRLNNDHLVKKREEESPSESESLNNNNNNNIAATTIPIGVSKRDSENIGTTTSDSTAITNTITITATTTTDSNSTSNSIKTKLTVSDSDEDNEKCQKLRRCSSLKTHQQQNDLLSNDDANCPARKKIVRFADALGLDLADVRTFMDDIPSVPKSAYSDLENIEQLNATDFYCAPCHHQDIAAAKKAEETKTFLVPIFEQPVKRADFLDIVRDKFVCLEQVSVNDCHICSVNGTVRVRNLDFHKSVYVRYSMDGWRSFNEIQANYVPNSCDGFSDQFCFIIYLYHLELGRQFEVAVRFHCKGFQYWDNNDGHNYVFHCLSTNRSLVTQQQHQHQQQAAMVLQPLSSSSSSSSPSYASAASYHLPPQSNPNGSSFY